MSTKGEAFAGLSVAITTPFKDGELDLPALRTQVEFQIAAGTQCLCPVGTTGESPTLSHEEHERVIAAVVEIAAGRIKVMPGTGSNSTREALRLTTLGRQARGRRRAGRRPVLQQADARGLLSAFQGAGRGGRHSDLHLQHSRPHRPRTSSRKRSSAWPSCRTSRWSRKRPARWIRPRRSCR